MKLTTPLHFRTAILVFCLLNLTRCQNEEVCSKPYAAIEKQATFIDMDLQVVAAAADSIFVVTTFKNNGEQDFAMYKPLLPVTGFTEDILHVGVVNTFEQVRFLGENLETYLTSNNSTTNDIVPKLADSNFVVLKPHDSITFQANIAKRFDFKSFNKQGINNFFVTYMPSFPYVVNNRHVKERGIDQELKPVYYYVDVTQEFHPDSGRINFSVPFK